MNWFKLDTDLIEGDSMAAAMSECPYALHALVWIFTRAAKKKSSTFEVKPVHIAGAAYKMGITPADMEKGIAQIEAIEIIERDGDTVRIPKWSTYQSEYAYRNERKAQKPVVEEKPAKSVPKAAPKPQKAQPATTFDLSAFPSLDTPEFRATFSEWLAFRKDMKKPVGNPNYSLKQLSEFSVGEAIERMKRGMANGWQGLVFPNEKKQYSSSPAANNPFSNLREEDFSDAGDSEPSNESL